MTRRTPSRSGSHPGTHRPAGAFGLVAAAGLIICAASAPAHATWGIPYLRPVKRQPPDQSWLQDVPERPGARSKGKVAVFVFDGDDVYQPIRAEVVRLLRRKGFNVTANLRPVDSAVQYREMSNALHLAAYVEGEVTGEGARQSARIRLRSGLSGQRVAAATFSGPTPKLVGAIDRGLWPRLGPAVAHACAGASHTRHNEREILRIDAGDAGDSIPVASRGD